MTRAQARVLSDPGAFLLPQEDNDKPLDATTTFGRDAPLGVEIGFGMGHALLAWGADRPDWNLLGIEVYQPGIGALLLGLEREALGNVRVVEGTAEQVLEVRLAEASVDEVRIFFPDPWPKKRHHKRRLVQPEFVRLLSSRLKPGATIWLATDWEPYAGWMLEVLDAAPELCNAAGRGFAERGAERVTTRFEARGERLGHKVWDLIFTRR